MTEIIIRDQKDPHDVDAAKDCEDFQPLKDGTISGDRKYCELSFQCKQLGMFAQYVTVTDSNGVITFQDYLCTGKHPIFEERSEDSEAS